MIIPNGYIVKAKFSLCGIKLGALVLIGVLILFSLFMMFLYITKMMDMTHWTSLMEFMRKVNSPSMWILLVIGLMLFAYMHAFVHEKIHQLCYRKFGSKANLHMHLFMPKVTLIIGDVCRRNKAIIVALSPLVVLEIAGFVAWPLVTGGLLFFTIFFLSANVALATGDLATVFRLRRYPSNHCFGFDGKDSVIFGPPED
jgi:hypothetical protein